MSPVKAKFKPVGLLIRIITDPIEYQRDVSKMEHTDDRH